MSYPRRVRALFLSGCSLTPSRWRIRLRARGLLSLLFAACALGATAAQAQAQGVPGAAGSDRVTINAYGGGFSPTAELSAEGGFRRSATAGGALTLWAHPNVGLRANVLYARTNLPAAAPEPLPGEDPNVWAYSADLVLRLPRAAVDGRDSWFPYLVGGVGGKTYRFDTLEQESDFAGNVGAGLEYRLARWGLQAEVRDLVSRFDRFGVAKTQHDVVWTAGLTLSF
jgi:hypothetical protein